MVCLLSPFFWDHFHVFANTICLPDLFSMVPSSTLYLNLMFIVSLVKETYSLFSFLHLKLVVHMSKVYFPLINQ